MRVVLCDDHTVLLEALGAALRNEGIDVVATVSTPGEALDTVRALRPDACLLDLTFPGESGLDAIGPLREAVAETKVVVMSALTDHQVVSEILAAGAHGFVGKDRPVTAVVAALEQAVAGQVAVDPQVLQDALRPRDVAEDPLWVLRFLTDREWDVMRCIMAGETTPQIAARLGIRRSTARTHVQNLLTKLGVHSRLQAAALMSTDAARESWPLRFRRDSLDHLT